MNRCGGSHQAGNWGNWGNRNDDQRNRGNSDNHSSTHPSGRQQWDDSGDISDPSSIQSAGPGASTPPGSEPYVPQSGSSGGSQDDSGDISDASSIQSAGSGASTPPGSEPHAPESGSSVDFTGGKEGLGVSNTSANGDGSNLASSNSSWYYNWSASASNNVNDPNAQFIPTIWGQGNMNDQDLAAAKNSSSSMLFTFNEPDHPGQANMTPQQALDNWDKLEATGKKLASPAITNGPEGVKWLDEFMQGAQASGKRVDSISLHWYGSSGSSTEQNLAAMKDHIEQVHEKYPDLPINLTEFGVDPNGNSAGQDPEFLRQAEEMLNGMDYVQMYAPYGLGTPSGNQPA